eukprot:10175717-Lingulodinium_polyedra.AAC.1
MSFTQSGGTVLAVDRGVGAKSEGVEPGLPPDAVSRFWAGEEPRANEVIRFQISKDDLMAS